MVPVDFGAVPLGWRKGRFKDLVGSAANGVWGDEPAGDEHDVYCVRAADFDRRALTVRSDNLPSRRVDPGGLRKHRLHPGDLVWEKSGGGETQPVGLAVRFDLNVAAVCSNFCTRVRPSAGTDSRYLVYAFAAAYAAGLNNRSIKQTTGLQNLDGASFLAEPWPIPPVLEQRRIAGFLDAETARIDALKAARQRMRVLLELRRERVIEKCLGVDIPVYEYVPLKYLVQSVMVGIVVTPAAWYVEDKGVPALRGVNVKPGRIVADDLVQISQEGHIAHGKSRLKAGDLVVVRTGQAGAAAVVTPEYDGANCIDLVIIRPGSSLLPRFAEYLLNSNYAKRRVAEHSVGSIQAHFNVAAMKLMPVPKRSVEEQARVVVEIDEAVSPIDAAIRRMEEQEKLLDERREALITAVVTGQIDCTAVRGVDA